MHYLDLLPSISMRLRHIDVDFDLIVTTDSEDVTAFQELSSLTRVGRRAILRVDNRGRDILPLTYLANFGLLDSYPFVLKVHTKKSKWRDESSLQGSGVEWREALLDSLLPENGFSRLVEELSKSPEVGLMTAEGSLLKSDKYWGANKARVVSLLKRIDLSPNGGGELEFPAGSMYLTRGFILASLRTFDLSFEDFEDEDGQIDGTTAHAVERLLGALVVEAGLQVVEIKGSMQSVGRVGRQRLA